MKNDIKVSVIVPVYNVEKYLEKCLDSLVKQTLKEIEIIVVNDGSPDNSQIIIDTFAKEYPDKIVALKKENGGLGDARNYGIKHAKGQYLGFVDSDDWVDPKMFEAMYQFATDNNDDIVLCDFIEINDGWEMGRVSKGYRGENPNPQKEDFLMSSMNPAATCNKLFRKELFAIHLFPAIFYEDVATTPILLAYANNIGYIPSAFYYYRQRNGSIIKTSLDKRNLQIITAWENVINNVPECYMQFVLPAIYQSIVAFLYFKPEFAENYLTFAKEKKMLFYENTIIRQKLCESRIENIFNKELIPRKIHYFWFGGNPKSELILQCMESWKRHAPDFEIVEWNETNCDIHVNKYVEQAYAAKKWAFVSDYFRIEKIYEYGGIYLDTDTELMSDPSKLLLNTAFFAFETRDAVHAGIFGATPKNPFISECLRSYEKSCFLDKDGSMNTSDTIVKRITKILAKRGIVLNGMEQLLDGDIQIYSPNVLTLNMFDGQNIAQHHYDCSWWDVKEGVISYKYTVLQDYFSDRNFSTTEDLSALEQAQRRIYEIENSTSWKITLPLRTIMNFVKRLLKRKRIFY